MQLGTMTALETALYVALLIAVIAFFPAMDGLRAWRHSRRRRIVVRPSHKVDKALWRRMFLWSVFSTKRVPRLTDQSEERLSGQRQPR
jgi:hypothetical protein